MRILLLLLLALPAAGQIFVDVSPSSIRQTIVGLGGNMPFADVLPGGAHAPDNVVYFLTTNLNPEHVRFFCNPQMEPANDNGSATSILWSGFPDNSEQNDKMLWFQKMRDRGAGIVMCPWYTPYWFWSHPIDPYMPTSIYPEAAEYILAWLLRAKNDYQVQIPWVQFNEPNSYSWGCTNRTNCSALFTPENMRDFIIQAGSRMVSSNLITKWQVADSWNAYEATAYMNVILTNATARQYCNSLSFHTWNSYNDSDYQSIAALADFYGLPVYVEELGTNPSLERDNPAYLQTWSYALEIAQQYHRSLYHAKAVGISYWSFAHYFATVNPANELRRPFGIVNPQTLAPYPVYYVIKQLMDHVRSGAQIVTTTSGSSSIMAFGANDPVRNKLVVQLVNTSGGSISTTVRGLGNANFTVYRSSATLNYSNEGVTPAVGGSLNLLLPGSSVTTLVSDQPTVADGAYYIDFAGGNDGNSGTDKGHPWKHHPRMRASSGGVGGVAGAHVHMAGERYIFKGGVTWLNSCFPLKPSWGEDGEGPLYDYYGVDKTWFAGATWTRPVFDAENQVMLGGNRFIDFTGPDITGGLYSLGNIIVDNIEFKRMYWTGPQAAGHVKGIVLLNSTNIIITNIYFHSWSFGDGLAGDGVSWPVGFKTNSGSGSGDYWYGTPDELQIIQGNNNEPYNRGCVIADSVFDGAPGGVVQPGAMPPGKGPWLHNYASGAVCYIIPNIIRCRATNVSNGFLVAKDCTVMSNTVSFAQSFVDVLLHHGNWIENASFGGLQKIGYNKCMGGTGAGILVGGFAGDLTYVYNNLCMDNESTGISIDSRPNGQGSAWVFNNTVVQTNNAAAIRIGAGTNRLNQIFVQNNHLITENDNAIFFDVQSPGTVANYVENFNLHHKTNAAALAGYTKANNFAPQNVGDATVGVGTTVSPAVSNDFRSFARPQFGNYDVGAYEFGTAGPGGGPAPPVVQGTVVTTNLQHNAARLEFISDKDTTNEVVWGTSVGYGSTNFSGVFTQSHVAVIGNLLPDTVYFYAVRVRDVDGVPSSYTAAGNSFRTAPVFVNLSLIQMEAGAVYHLDKDTTGTNTYLSQSVQTTETNDAGRVTFALLVATNGDYRIRVRCNFPDGGSNSWFVNFNTAPEPPMHIFDSRTNLTVGFQDVLVSHRGTQDFCCAQFDPWLVTLATGTNILYWAARERGAFIDSFGLELMNSPQADTTNPFISNVFVENLGPFSARVRWTTDEPANSLVDYSYIADFDTTNSDSAFLFSTDHNVFLTGLVPLTLFAYQVRSADPSGNWSTNGPNYFMTTSADPVKRVARGKVRMGGRLRIR